MLKFKVQMAHAGHHVYFTRLLGRLVCTRIHAAMSVSQLVTQRYHSGSGARACTTAAVLQHQWPSQAAAASELPLQQLLGRKLLQRQHLGRRMGLQQAVQLHPRLLCGPAAAAQWQERYPWQQNNWRNSCPQAYRTSSYLQRSARDSDSKSGEPGVGYPPDMQQPGQQQEPLDSSTAFIHGIRSSHEPPLHDLHYRISQIKPRTAAPVSGVSSNDLYPGIAAGDNADGELDSSSSSSRSSSYAVHEVDGDDALSTGNTDASSGALRLRFRRKTPLFQVIEFHASGTAIEEYRERTPNELGLHPRDVTLFAPLSRLAAPQRATIAVHDGKILVKTEVVKAIITPDKAVLIKSRRQRDTQKIAQAILAANDQRLMAIKLWQHQHQEIRNTSSPVGLDSCKRAASAADLIMQHNQSTQSRAGYKSSRVTYSDRAGYVQLLTPGSAGSLSPSVVNPSVPRQQSSARVIEPAGVAAAGDALRRTAGGSSSFGSDLKDVPFEMLVLEVLLDATTEYFYTKVQHLNWMLESIGADIRQPGQVQGAIDKAHQLIPIQKFLSSLKNDVKETCAAVQTALEDDDTLHDLCLSWHLQQRSHTAWSPIELQHHKAGGGFHGQYNDSNGVAYSPAANGAGLTSNKLVSSELQVRMMTEMLESYEREIQSLAGSINEAEEDMDNTRWGNQVTGIVVCISRVSSKDTVLGCWVCVASQPSASHTFCDGPLSRCHPRVVGMRERCIHVPSGVSCVGCSELRGMQYVVPYPPMLLCAVGAVFQGPVAHAA
eukprot:GHUV01018307.1.p1 GENE.GHUV01018307.1~~GHUV01018307.1.p1  ORF type:complete len:773 (+),score=257.30 GHUV01018307.1:352-2670(+)